MNTLIETENDYNWKYTHINFLQVKGTIFLNGALHFNFFCFLLIKLLCAADLKEDDVYSNADPF